MLGNPTQGRAPTPPHTAVLANPTPSPIALALYPSPYDPGPNSITLTRCGQGSVPYPIGALAPVRPLRFETSTHDSKLDVLTRYYSLPAYNYKAALWEVAAHRAPTIPLASHTLPHVCTAPTQRASSHLHTTYLLR